jgi:thiamine biosynthesis lipoprotein
MKKQNMLALLLALCLFTALALPSCGGAQKNKYTAYSLDYFDTATTITGYETDRATFDAISGEILALLGEYHRLYTIYHRFEGIENLCTVNDLTNGAHRRVTVDARIIEMLSYAKEMYDVTGGEVNIAMGSVLSIWHQYRTAGLDAPHAAKLPPIEALEAAAKHTDIGALVIDKEQSTVQITDPEMTLDVGAIAKGYAVEMAAQMLEARGITGYVINVGGNIRTVGTKGDGSKWLAGIENPDASSDEPYIAYVELSGESIVTSGSYQRYYLVDGQRYHHIIDRETLMPATGFLSVSVICKSSAQADALSTALFCMSPDEGLALVESLPDVEALWVSTDGTQRTSSGFSAYLRKDK